MMPSVRSTLRAGFGLAMVLLAANAVITYWNIETLVANDRDLLRSRDVLQQIDHTVFSFKDALPLYRSYVASGSDAQLANFQKAVADINGGLDRIAVLSADNPFHQARIPRLKEALKERVDQLRDVNKLRREKGTRAVEEALRSTRPMDFLRWFLGLMDEMAHEENRLIDLRSQASRAAIQRTILTFAVATVLALGLLGSVLWLALSDLAHRQRAAEELQRSEAWLSTTLESIGDAIIATDAKGSVRLLNPVARRLTGWTQEGAKGRPLEEVFVIINEERRSKVESPVARIIREGCVVGLANHTILIAKDGSEQPIDDSGAPIRGDDGSIDGVVLCFRDVAERTRADRQAARLASLVESSEDAIIGTGLDGTIQSWNRGAAGIFGYEAEEVVGRPVATLFRPYRPEEISALFEALRRGERVVHTETQWLCADGRGLDVSLAVSPIKDSEGRPFGVSIIARDVTERRRVEEELRAAKEVAEAADRAKDHFLSVLSHELRTPLTPVLFSVSAMLENGADPSVRPTLEMIRRNIELESRLIDDLLDVSRIARGDLHLDLKPVDVHEVIRRAVEICQSEIRASGLRVACNLAALAHHTLADEARLMQVFWNLTQNCTKFAQGGILNIRTGNEGLQDPDNGECRLIVEFHDDGIGIDPERIASIFKPFEQGHSISRKRFGGLGLGLAISRSVIESHQGRMTARSSGRGKGMSFRIELTTTAAPIASPPTLTPPPSPVSVSRNFKILLVEDNSDTLRYLALILGQQGHEVWKAETESAARMRLDERAFDLLISDIELPDGSGLDLMRDLSGCIVGIAMSGFGTEEDIRLSQAAGFAAHLTKPIDLPTLEATIRSVFSKPAPADPVHEETAPDVSEPIL
jgi:PAS domain S-box-containing protein